MLEVAFPATETDADDGSSPAFCRGSAELAGRTGAWGAQVCHVAEEPSLTWGRAEWSLSIAAAAAAANPGWGPIDLATFPRETHPSLKCTFRKRRIDEVKSTSICGPEREPHCVLHRSQSERTTSSSGTGPRPGLGTTAAAEELSRAWVLRLTRHSSVCPGTLEGTVGKSLGETRHRCPWQTHGSRTPPREDGGDP